MFGSRSKGVDPSRIARAAPSRPALAPKQNPLPVLKKHVKRNAERIPSYKTGFVVFPKTGYKRDCAILDYSRSGMRLRFPNYEELPLELELVVPEMKVRVIVAVRWQDLTDAGVRFLRPSPNAKTKS